MNVKSEQYTLDNKTINTTLEVATKHNLRLTPVFKNGTSKPFKDGQRYENESDFIGAKWIGLVLDNLVLVDYDGNKAGGDIASTNELARMLGLEKMPKPIQVNKTGDSIHWLFEMPKGLDKSQYNQANNGQWSPHIDIKTGNQLMHLKPAKNWFPHLLEQGLLDAPKSLMKVLEKSSTSTELKQLKRWDGSLWMLNEAREILSYCDANCAYDKWNSILMGIHERFGDSVEALNLADEWSAGGDTYPERAVIESKLKSYTQDSGITFATACREARSNGADLSKISKKHNPIGLASMPSAANDKCFELTHISSLLKQPKPTKWLIEGYLPPEGLAFVIGEPATGKSFLAIDWACSVVTGRLWNGKKVDQGGVVILAGEGHYGIRRRLAAWEVESKISLADKPLAVSDRGASLAEDGNIEEVINALDKFAGEHGAIAMVVVDTLHRNLGTGDENSSKDMGAYVSNLDSIRSRFNCVIVTVHHTGHSAQHRARGSSAIKGSADAEYLVQIKNGINRLSCSKMKDSERPQDVGFNLETVIIPWKNAENENETSAVIRFADVIPSDGEKALGKNSVIVFKSLVSLYVLSCSEDSKWKFPASALRDKARLDLKHSKSDSKKKAFASAMKDLVSRGYIESEADGVNYLLLDKLMGEARAIFEDAVGAHQLQVSLNVGRDKTGESGTFPSISLNKAGGIGTPP